MRTQINSDYYWTITSNKSGQLGLLLSDYNGDALSSGLTVYVDAAVIPVVDVDTSTDLSSVNVEDEILADALVHSIMANIGKKFVKDSNALAAIKMHEEFYRENLIKLKKNYRSIKR